MGTSDDERLTDAQDAVDPLDGETVATPNDHLQPGTEVGGYIVDTEIGSGGMGVVYSATHPVIGKRAAIKVLRPELSKTPAAVERFIMEARAVNQIGHPNIVDIFAFGTLPDGRSYYVMDYLTGETLRRRLKRGPLHVSEAASVIDDVADALIAAHDKGIIHRDLKPDNVFMVTVAGRWPEVRILDWGLLKLSSTQSAVSSGKYRTLAGSVMGTPVYMSPEQGRSSDTVDSRTDVYSLGVMAYELLAGVAPFRKGSSVDTLLAHQEEPVPSLAARCPALPEELVQLIEAMLAKDREERPTLAAVRTVLRRLKGTKIPTMTAAGLEMPGGSLDTTRRSGVDLDPSIAVTTHPRHADPASRSLSDSMPLPPPPPTPFPGTPAVDLSTTLAGHSSPVAPMGAPRSSLQQHQQFPPLMAPRVSGSQVSQQPPERASLPWQAAPALPPLAPTQQGRPSPQTSNAGRMILIIAVAAIASGIGILLLLLAS